jgi:hypothetical protein
MLNPFVKCSPGLVSGERLSIAFKLGFERSVEHQGWPISCTNTKITKLAYRRNRAPGLVPLCFRSSCQSTLRRITNFGNGHWDRDDRLRGTPQSPSYTRSSSAVPPRRCRASYLLDWNAAFCSCRRAKLLHEQQFHLVTKRFRSRQNDRPSYPFRRILCIPLVVSSVCHRGLVTGNPTLVR